uniref:helix-turn-helix domain-containing protein n=3 Tax=Shigella boydii TaxID=621 RepID=UPI0035C7CE52
MRAEIALMSGSAFAVTHHAFSSGAGRTSDGNGSHASTLKSPSYTKSVSWQHYPLVEVEKEVILAALEKTGGNKTEAARQLGITRKTLLAKLSR